MRGVDGRPTRFLFPYKTVQTTVSPPRDDNGVNDARRESVRVRQLCFGG
jgi:hypothetical protein